MRIYTNVNGEAIRACRLPGVYLDVETHGSRKRAYCHNVHLSADYRGVSRRRANSGRYGATEGRTGEYAATWDEWGVFLARVFALDATAICGPYNGADDFAWQTGGSYGDGTHFTWRCINHIWRVGVPGEQRCANNCGAIRRWKMSAA